jgi:hypothetical protein
MVVEDPEPEDPIGTTIGTAVEEESSVITPVYVAIDAEDANVEAEDDVPEDPAGDAEDCADEAETIEAVR